MLIEVEPLRDMVQLTLQSAFVEPYLPVNLLLIGKPETAKTSILTLTQKKDFILYTNEITAKLMIDILLPEVERGTIKYLIIPDILNCIEKQKATRQQFLNFIKSLIEEGITSVYTYHKRYTVRNTEDPVRCGLITAITTVDFKRIRKYLENIGLLSRFIPFSYDYSIEKIKKILEYLESEENRESYDFFIKKERKQIKGSKELFKEFEMVSMKLATQYQGFGFRTQIRLQHLAKANALLNGREEVTKEDIEKIIRLSNWINFDFNTL